MCNSVIENICTTTGLVNLSSCFNFMQAYLKTASLVLILDRTELPSQPLTLIETGAPEPSFSLFQVGTMRQWCCAIMLTFSSTCELQLNTELVDECAQGLDNCDVNAMCTDLPQRFECVCNSGFTGNGITCTGLIVYCSGRNSTHAFMLQILSSCVLARPGVTCSSN